MVKCEIIGYDHFGRGIAKLDEKIIFVPKGRIHEIVPIEIVKDKKNYSIAKRKDLLSFSFCPYFARCGGCQIAHLSYEEQLEFKKEKVENILKNYAGISLEEPLEIIKTKQTGYRNKAVFHIEKDRIGFYEEESHTLLDIDYCPLLHEKMNHVLSCIKEFIKTHQGLEEALVRVLSSKVMLCLKGKEDKESVKDFFSSFVDSLYYNDTLLTGLTKLEATLFDTLFFVSKDAFFQVNDVGVLKIYQEVRNFIKKREAKRVLDLYCGVGTISLLVASLVDEVIGIELVPSAIIDAKESAKKANIKNAKFHSGDVSYYLPKLREKIDTVIVDPPRSGLDKKTRGALLNLKPKSIVYVSCDVLTLARDLKYFSSFYEVDSVKAIDEFPNTYHVECVSLLSLKEN